MYIPATTRHKQLVQSECTNLKRLVTWQHSIGERFSTVKIKMIFINGVKDGKVTASGLLQIKLLLDLGKMLTNELQVEFVLLKNGTINHDTDFTPVIIPLRCVESDLRKTGVLTYVAEYQIEDTGFYQYGIRVVPCNHILFRKQDAKVVYWG